MSRIKKPRSSRASAAINLPLSPAVSTAEVVEKMQAIHAALPDSDGLKWFNFLYLSVTLAVKAQIAVPKAFEDSDWIEHLDIGFANYYFAALATAQQSGIKAGPAAWQPLLENRTQQGIARIQFALAGMNAHINRDLVAALLAQFNAEKKAPGLLSARFRDYNRINQILEQTETQLRSALLIGTPLAAGGHLAPLENMLAMWSVKAARQAAWDHSQALWQLRSIKAVQQASFDALDGLTELAGNGLLTRVLP